MLDGEEETWSLISRSQESMSGFHITGLHTTPFCPFFKKNNDTLLGYKE